MNKEDNNPLKIAYAVAEILVNKGYRAGVSIGASDAAVVIKFESGQMLQVKISQGLTEKGVEWIATEIEEHLKKIN